MTYKCQLRVWNVDSQTYKPLIVEVDDCEDAIALKAQANDYGYFDDCSIEGEKTLDKAWEAIMKLRRE